MKRLLLSTLFLFFAVAAFAQKGAVSGTVLDADTGESVAGAVLEVAPVKTPDQKQYFTSGYKGAVAIPSLPYGEYRLTVSFLGYNNYETTFRVAAGKQNIGRIELKPGVQIETVVKEAKALRTSQKGDTVSYNAGAFKVTNDADVEGLLKKMPGITVSDGTVEAQGEQIKKVFVDGKEFFGEDVTTAIKSLPAQAVDRVEVYNKLSDAAEFSGMDDGEGYKALNIVTHANMRQGQFGKLYAGYGYDADTKTEAKNKYVVGGNANIFSGSSRVSVIGLFNNINQQNFSFEDILGVSGGSGRGRRGGVGQYMVRPQSGVASVNAIGVNYSDTWGKRDQVSFQGSYFFNNTDTRNRSTIDKWYESPMPVDTLSTRGYSDTESYNHRFNARLEWKISDNQNLMVRPSFSYQSNDPLSTTQGWQFGESGYSRTENRSDALRHGYNVRTNAVYRAKLGKDGRTITVDGDVNYSDNTNNSNSFSNVLPLSDLRPDGVDAPWGWDTTGYTRLRYLRDLAPSSSYRLRGQFSYTEPVAKYAQVSLQYRISYDYQERDKKSYITGADYSIAGLAPDGALSNSYRSNYLTQSAGPGFRYSKERNTFIANVFYQRSSLDGQIVRDDADKIRHSYNNVTYFMMGQLNINRENSLRLYVSSYTDNPSITDLQNVADVSDAQNITKGNPDLNPTYSHRVNFHYINSNVEKGRTFMWMFSMQNTSDYNATHVVSNPGTITLGGVQYKPNYYSTPVNLDGYCGLHAVYRFHERLRRFVPALQRMDRQEDIQEQARRDHVRRERPAQPQQGFRPHDGFGMDAECDQQRDRPLLHGAVHLQPAPLRQEGVEEHLRLRRGRAVGTPPHGTRRSGRAASGYLPRSAVTSAVRTKKTSGAMPDVFFVIMPEACFRFVLVPVCRADGRPFLRTGRGGSCGCLGVAVTFPVRRCAAPGCRPCPRG